MAETQQAPVPSMPTVESNTSDATSVNDALAIIMFVIVMLIMVVNLNLDVRRSQRARVCSNKFVWRDALAILLSGLSFVASVLLLFVGASINSVGYALLTVFVVFGVGSILSAIVTTSTSVCLQAN